MPMPSLMAQHPGWGKGPAEPLSLLSILSIVTGIAIGEKRCVKLDASVGEVAPIWWTVYIVNIR